MTTNPKMNVNHLPQMPAPRNAWLPIFRGKSLGIEINLESEKEKCITGNNKQCTDNVSQAYMDTKG